MSPTSCPACGALHQSPLEELVLKEGALESLGAFLQAKGWRELVVVGDANTFEVLGERVVADLVSGGHLLTPVVFPERHGLLADEAATDRVRAAIATSGAPAAIVVGSGTLNDITRYASFLEGRPYCSVPTAASMDGYASSVAAMQFGGVKLTFPAQAPLAIFTEPSVLAGAPSEMTTWGLGDLSGKVSACFDWRLGHAVTGEPYCPAVESRVLTPLAECVGAVDRILSGDEEGIAVLASGLIESGVAMAMQGNSRPASGSEHHASHFWDLLAYRGLRAHAPHGLQVAYATGFVGALQRAALDGLDLPLVEVPGAFAEDEVAWLGEGDPTLAGVREQKATAFVDYSRRWPPPAADVENLQERLVALGPLFQQVDVALARAGVPTSPGFLEVDQDMLAATLRFANRLRSRFSVLDLLESQGRLAPEVDRLLSGAG
ncbi:MAG: glycerol-phosphate dehydrogenase [Acidimicrobiaceae bacterium]|nr:glycerol-phosphate dehydrogenase [Acidimicrobiaceae bacterium]